MIALAKWNINIESSVYPSAQVRQLPVGILQTWTIRKDFPLLLLSWSCDASLLSLKSGREERKQGWFRDEWIQGKQWLSGAIVMKKNLFNLSLASGWVHSLLFLLCATGNLPFVMSQQPLMLPQCLTPRQLLNLPFFGPLAASPCGGCIINWFCVRLWQRVQNCVSWKSVVLSHLKSHFYLMLTRTEEKKECESSTNF